MLLWLGEVGGWCILELKQENVILREGSQEFAHLCLVIEQLPQRHREIIMLYLKVTEQQLVAQKLGISEREAGKRKREACAYLRKHAVDCWGIVMALLF